MEEGWRGLSLFELGGQLLERLDILHQDGNESRTQRGHWDGIATSHLFADGL